MTWDGIVLIQLPHGFGAIWFNWGTGGSLLVDLLEFFSECHEASHVECVLNDWRRDDCRVHELCFNARQHFFLAVTDPEPCSVASSLSQLDGRWSHNPNHDHWKVTTFARRHVSSQITTISNLLLLKTRFSSHLTSSNLPPGLDIHHSHLLSDMAGH